MLWDFPAGKRAGGKLCWESALCLWVFLSSPSICVDFSLLLPVLLPLQNLEKQILF